MSNVSSRAVPWRVWTAVAFGVFVFIASQIIASLVIWFFPSLLGWSHDRTVDWVSHSLTAQFLFFCLAFGLTLGSIYMFIRPYGREGLRAIGLKKPKWIDPLLGLAAVPVYIATYLIIVTIVLQFAPGLDINQKQELGFNGSYSGLQLVLVFVSLVILPPLTEEIVFRGFLYSTLKKLGSTAVAVLVTSILFAAGHLAEGGASGPLYIAAIDTFTLSLILIYLREKTGRLWASMTLHAIKNAIAFVSLFVLHVT